MREVHGVSLTYCTNVHPGDSWLEVLRAVRAHVPRVREGIGGNEPFPLCLWLSRRAAQDVDERAAAEMRDWCRANGCRVTAINGFPYGAFHGRAVKRDAYLPDWRHPDRRDHTRRLADILAAWLEGDAPGVVSTVPLGYGRDGAEWECARDNLVSTLEHLDGLAQASGKHVILALEPEPGCVLETTAQVVRFFESLDLSEDRGRYLGVCYDCCHQAVQFERAAQSLAALAGAGIRVAQAHVSAALRAPGTQLALLAQLDEPRYLHQTIGRRRDGTLARFEDLPAALAASPAETHVEEWRVHFHVPIFARTLGDCATTQPDLEEALAALDPAIPLVVETYTFDVLPERMRTGSLDDSLVRELRWARERLALRARAEAGR
jgi:sugar phosphate isomerase/epimerase